MEKVRLEVIVIIQVKESFIQFNHILLVFPQRQTFKQGGHLLFGQFSKD